MMKTSTPRVVIVGAGFAGLNAARSFEKLPVEVILVDKNNYHNFVPLLYQVAAAELEVEEIVFPIRSILKKQKNARFVMAQVTDVDLDYQRILTSNGSISYDYLILAMGSQTTYYDVPGAEKYGFPMKTLDDAVAIRNHILSCFERAEYEEDPEVRQQLLNFVVAGGGSAGVEFAGALSELVYGPLTKEFKAIDFNDVNIILVDSGVRLLAQYPKKLSNYTLKRLEKMKVDVILQNGITAVERRGVELSNGVSLGAQTVIWTAGVMGLPVCQQWGFSVNARYQIVVRSTLQTFEDDHIFVLGDLGNIVGQDIPLLASVAVQQGKFVVNNIMRHINNIVLKKFAFKDNGMMSVIGRNAAVAQFGKIKLAGFLAWLMWSVFHLFKLIGVRNKLNVMINWIWSYLFFESAAKVILPRVSTKNHIEEISQVHKLIAV